MNKYVVAMGAATVLFAVLLFGVAYGQFEGESDSILTKWLKTISGQTDKQTAFLLAGHMAGHAQNHDIKLIDIHNIPDNTESWRCIDNRTNYCTVPSGAYQNPSIPRTLVLGSHVDGSHQAEYLFQIVIYTAEQTTCKDRSITLHPPKKSGLESYSVPFNNCVLKINGYDLTAGQWTWQLDKDLKGTINIINMHDIMGKYAHLLYD